MANVAAARFVKQLVAAFARYPVSPETKELYLQKLSNWRLTQSEWDGALDRIVEQHTDDNLPQLAEIYRFLKNQSFNATGVDGLGWLYFNSGGSSYAVRVKYDQGVWVNAPLDYTDIHGKKISLQRNPGKVPQLPADASGIILRADKPELIHTEAA